MTRDSNRLRLERRWVDQLHGDRVELSLLGAGPAAGSQSQFGMWADPADDERGESWARDLRADVRPWASAAVYLTSSVTKA